MFITSWIELTFDIAVSVLSQYQIKAGSTASFHHAVLASNLHRPITQAARVVYVSR